MMEQTVSPPQCFDVRRVWRIAAAFVAVSAALLAAPHGAAAQEARDSSTYVLGTVVDSAGVAIAGAEIRLLPASAGRLPIASDARGEFNLVDLPPGLLMLVVRKLGYAPRLVPLRLERLVANRVRVELSPLAQQLAAFTIRERSGYGSSRLAGFAQRQAMGMGRFYDREMLERRNPTMLSDLMMTVPGVTIGFDEMGNRIILGRPYGFGSQCPMPIFLDGMRIPDLPIDQAAHPKEVAGIEVYNSVGNVPLQYRSHGTICGAILIWTRGQ